MVAIADPGIVTQGILLLERPGTGRSMTQAGSLSSPWHRGKVHRGDRCTANEARIVHSWRNRHPGHRRTRRSDLTLAEVAIGIHSTDHDWSIVHGISSKAGKVGVGMMRSSTGSFYTLGASAERQVQLSSRRNVFACWMLTRILQLRARNHTWIVDGILLDLRGRNYGSHSDLHGHVSVQQ